MRKHTYLFVYFALGIFAAFEADSYFGVLQGSVLGTTPEYLAYGVGCFAAAAGVAMFLGLKRLKAPLKRGLIVVAFILTAILPAVAWLVRTPAVFWVSCVVFYLMAGVNTGICAYYLHRLMKMETRAGTLLAVASVCGLALNFLVDFLSPNASVLKMAFLAVAILAMLVLALRKIALFELLDYRDDVGSVSGTEGVGGVGGTGSANSTPGTSGTRGADEGEQRKHFLSVFITVAVAVAIMSYMIGVNDIAIVVTLLAGPEPSVFIPQALLYLPALLIAGILADVKGGRYLPIATLGCTLLTAPTVTRLASPEVFTQYSGVTYFLGGFYLIYLMVSLVTLAHRGRRPIVVTSLAAFLFFLFSGLGAFTSYLYIHADSAFSLTVYIVLVALLLVIFYLSGSLQPRIAEPVLATSAQPPALSTPPAPPAPALKELTAGYGVTNREIKVLELLIEGKSTTEIAEAMAITDKSVRNYVSSLMSKTASSSRGKLVARFTGRAS